MNDGDERTIQAQLGHASAEMTRRYIREPKLSGAAPPESLGSETRASTSLSTMLPSSSAP